MHISSQVVAESRPRVLHIRNNYSRHIPAPAQARSVQVLLLYVEWRILAMDISTITSENFIRFQFVEESN
jgi:hypothetical protein